MCICFAASCDWRLLSVVEASKASFNVCSPIQHIFCTCLDLVNLCVLLCVSCTLDVYNIWLCCAWHLAVWICLHKMCMFMSPGVKHTFPHIPICGAEFPGVKQEAGVVLLVAFSGRPSPNRAPFIGAQHLINCGAVLVSQGGRGCITILLRIYRDDKAETQRRNNPLFIRFVHWKNFLSDNFGNW